jgi:PAS domain S-box-containing protein
VPEDVRASQLLDQAPDAVIYADVAGVIRYWNGAAERVFGHRSPDAVGHSLDLIIPEQFRAAHWAGYERAVAAGRTKYVGQALTTRAQRADDAAIYVDLAFAIIHGDDGAVTGVLATARDVTARFTAERELRRRLRALEERTGDAGPAD